VHLAASSKLTFNNNQRLPMKGTQLADKRGKFDKENYYSKQDNSIF